MKTQPKEHPVGTFGNEQGFTMIEVMASIFILAVAIFSLITVTYGSLKATSAARVRETGVAMVANRAEYIRANDYGNVELKPNSGTGGSTVPSTFSYRGATYNTIVGTAPCNTCLAYQKEYESNDHKYLVTTVVASVDDPADGTGEDSPAVTTDYKKIFLTIESTDTTPKFSYTTSTVVGETDADPGFAPIQGLQLDLVDANGDRIVDGGLTFTLDISGPVVTGEEIDEGQYINLSMNVGTYTCTISNSANSLAWHPQDNSSSNTDVFQCNVTEGDITTYTRTWIPAAVCVADANDGTLTVTVTNAITSAPIPSASVNPTPLDGQTPDPGAQTANGSGVATFTLIESGSWEILVTKAGYDDATIDSTCVGNGINSPVTAAMMPAVVATADITLMMTSTSAGTKKWKLVAGEPPSSGIYKSLTQNVASPITISVPPFNGQIKVYCEKAGPVDQLKKTYPSATTTAAYPAGPTTLTWSSNC